MNVDFSIIRICVSTLYKEKQLKFQRFPLTGRQLCVNFNTRERSVWLCIADECNDKVKSTGLSERGLRGLGSLFFYGIIMGQDKTKESRGKHE